MNKLIFVTFYLSLFLFSFSFFPVFQKELQNNLQNNSENDSIIENKITNLSILNTLGWEIDEVRNILVPISPTDIGTFKDVRCKGIAENVVVLVEEALHTQKSYDFCQGFAERFQRDAYEPIEEYIGVPRASTVDNTSSIAIIFADFGASSGLYNQDCLSINGFESVQVSLSQSYPMAVRMYHSCLHLKYRDILEERWFNVGLGELLPSALGFTTSNESTYLPNFTGEESGGISGTNIPLLYWDYLNDNSFRNTNYGASYAFTYYVYEHYGLRFLGDVLRNTDCNITESFNQALATNGYDITFKDLLADWALAVRLDDPQLNPLWNYKWLTINANVANQAGPPSESDLPIEFNAKVFEAAGSTHRINIRDDSTNALKYDFDGKAPGEYRVYLIASEFVNISFTKKYLAEIVINPETQDGSGFIMLPNNAMYVDILVVNTYYKDTGTNYMLIPLGTDLDTLREEFTCNVSSFDPELVGNLETIDYNNGTFHIEVILDWNLEETLEDYGMSPHVVLYDADGEFAFNLQTPLSYDASLGKWIGDLVITDDIKSGNYIIKLFIQGTELDSAECEVKNSSNAHGFLFLPSFLAAIVIIIKRKK